jgi:hypothetical protein
MAMHEIMNESGFIRRGKQGCSSNPPTDHGSNLEILLMRFLRVHHSLKPTETNTGGEAFIFQHEAIDRSRVSQAVTDNFELLIEFVSMAQDMRETGNA